MKLLFYKTFNKTTKLLIWLGGVAAGLIFLIDMSKYVFLSVNSTEELRKNAKKCLIEAHMFVNNKNYTHAKKPYLCAQKNMIKAATKGDLKASYALANLYSEENVGVYLNMTRQDLSDKAVHYWCQARKGGFDLAKITPPFLKYFSLTEKDIPC